MASRLNGKSQAVDAVVIQGGTAFDAFDVSPSDSAIIQLTDSIFVGVAGNVKVRMGSGRDVTWPLSTGFHPIQCDRIYSNGTTATGIKAVYGSV
jgi:hypothetical protein